VAEVADAAGIREWRAQVRPEQKADVIRGLQAQGHRVVMVGDGINDALALSTADVGVAVANGSDVAHSASGVVLLSPGLKALRRAISIAHQAFHTLRCNLAVGTCYNLIAIPTAMAGLVVPLLAAVAMPISSLLVVVNSLRGEP
ncbi:MAG TPA: HAD-IC family P-type ATPase, partial [Candidatus Xenobia bacterium]